MYQKPNRGYFATELTFLTSPDRVVPLALPLSCELGRYKTVKARLWPEILKVAVLEFFKLFPLRAEAGNGKIHYEGPRRRWCRINGA